MHVFVYEFVTGGGWFFIDDDWPPDGMLREGAAMLHAAAEDFAALSGTSVSALWDARLTAPKPCTFNLQPVECSADHDKNFSRLAAAADFSLVIAPEFDQILLRVGQRVVAAGGKLIGPDAAFVALASDKHRTALHLAAAGVPTPQGIALTDEQNIPYDFSYPAVLKPRDGAGSQGVQLVASREEVAQMAAANSLSRLERFYPGTPASVAALCGSAKSLLLPPMRQCLSADGRFAYLGGANDLTPNQRNRSHELAQRTLDALPRTSGYVGIDMVLGEDASGCGDVVIEINPRLTTSYIGLRKIVRENLAGAMLALAAGNTPDLSFRQCEVEFSADGEVEVLSKPHTSPTRKRG